MSNVNQVYAYLKQLEDAAVAFGGEKTKVFADKINEALTAFEAAVPELAVAAEHAAIKSLQNVNPLFGILVPAEVFLDPAVSGLANTFESLLLNGKVPVPAIPQPQAAA